ncbi:hypothetical protein Y025_5569 [Burkholderia pseudomallei TSV32]|nr:hypothetical protein Y025_5569 [Burkholderia pseudomallei TSV32]
MGFVSSLDGLQPVFSVSARRKSGSLKISANVARRTPPPRSDRAELPAQELVEVLHAVFHRALIRADLRFAALHQRAAAGVHAPCDLVVLDRGLHIGGALRLDELALEQRDFLGVVELDDVRRLLRAARNQPRHHEHVRIPLDHEARVIDHPDRAELRRHAVAITEHLIVPLLVRRAARLRERVVHAHRLHAVPVAEFPLQVVARHEAAEARMERHDVVVLEVDLDEGLPVVIALVDLDVIEQVVRKVEMVLRAELREIVRDIAALGLEQQPLPVLQRRRVQVQAGLVRKVRRAEQLAFEIVGPAMQRADDVLRTPAAVQHDRLAVAAHVRQQLDLRSLVAHQHAAFVFGRQRKIISCFGHHQFVPDIARSFLEKCFDFAREERLIEISGDGKLAMCRLQLQCVAQIGHSHSR